MRTEAELNEHAEKIRREAKEGRDVSRSCVECERLAKENERLRAERDALKRRFDKLATVGCTCGTDECEAGDCYGCRGHMLGFMQEELELAEHELSILRAVVEEEA